jgi:hypothetical protein
MNIFKGVIQRYWCDSDHARFANVAYDPTTMQDPTELLRILGLKHPRVWGIHIYIYILKLSQG